MPKYDRASAEVSGWKQHQCVSCGCLFRYRMRRSGSGSGITPEVAVQNAHRAALLRLQREVDSHPCPSCGAFQPIMFVRARGRRLVSVAAVAWLLLAGPIVVMILQMIRFPLADLIDSIVRLPFTVLASWLTVPPAIVLLTLQFWTLRHNPNRNTELNLLIANKDVREKALVVIEPSNLTRAVLPKNFGSLHVRHWTLLCLMALGCCAAVVPEATRLANGWTTNLRCQPTVLGPGDWVRVTFSEPIPALAGNWNGTSRARINNSEELGLIVAEIVSKTKQGTWEQSIQVRQNDNSESYVWLEACLPDNERLVKKSLQMDLELDVIFPQKNDQTSFALQRRFLKAKREILLTSPRAGSTYWFLWLLGSGSVFGLFLIGGSLLWWFDARLPYRATPHLFTPEAETIE